MSNPVSVGDDLVERLRAACVGHPYAKIEWPHRLLHEAASQLAAVTAERDALALSWSEQLTRATTAEAQLKAAREALRNIAEGNLGDDPWQANYDKIRSVARAALDPKAPS